MRTGHLSVPAAINLWEGMIRSQMEYGCEIWGSNAWMDGDQIQHDMARRILRCSSQTAIAAMMGDLGWWSLQARRDQRRLIYWGNLVMMPADRLTKIVYLKRREVFQHLPSSWCQQTKQLLNVLGLSEYWNDEFRFPRNVEVKKTRL